jgi:hypothetical protein
VPIRVILIWKCLLNTGGMIMHPAILTSFDDDDDDDNNNNNNNTQ